MDIIKQYFRLCAIRNPTVQKAPAQKRYFVLRDGNYYPRESIIGSNANGSNNALTAAEPTVVGRGEHTYTVLVC